MSDEAFKCPWPSCIATDYMHTDSKQNRYHQRQNGDE